MDSTIVSTALITIAGYFDGFVNVQWVVLSYLLSYLAFAIIVPRVSDVIGRKRAALAAFFLMGAFSCGCALSQTLNQLIAFRALQGIAGSGLLALAFTVLPEVTPPKIFPIMSVVVGMLFATSAVLGPVLGGVITTHTTWRWVFWLNVPCCAVTIVAILLTWPEIYSPGRITWRQLDYLGSLLYAAACTLLIFALQEAGTSIFAWSSAAIIASLVSAAVAAIICFAWLWFFSNVRVNLVAPLFHMRIVRQRVLIATILQSSLIGYIFYTALIGLPERYQIVYGRNPQSSGLSILPLSGASAVGSALAGFLSSKYNKSFYTIAASGCFCMLGSGLIYTIGYSPDAPARLYGYQAILGLGFGMTFSSSTVMIKLNARPEDAASAQGLLGQSRLLGGNIGLAIATIVLNSHFDSDLSSVLSGSTISDLKKSLNTLDELSLVQQQAVAASYSNALQTQMEICIVVAAAALICGLFTWQRHPPSFQDWDEDRTNGTENTE